MSYCHVHGRYEGDGCPECRETEGTILQSLAESQENLNDVANRIANPGDYDCPSCMFRTLKRGASRCPKCHAGIGQDYWEGVRRQEELQRKAAAEAWERGRPAREAQAKRDRARAVFRKRREIFESVLIGGGVLYWLYQLVDIVQHSHNIIDAALGLIIGGCVMGFLTAVVVAAAIWVTGVIGEQVEKFIDAAS